MEVVLLHGTQPVTEQLRICEDFAHGKGDVLVCTAALDPGFQLPKVRSVVVEQAEHLAASRLAWLRGWLVDAVEWSYVVGSEAVEPSEGRAGSPRQAEQPALPRLRAARETDTAILTQAREAAHALLRADSGLRNAAPVVALTARRVWSAAYDTPCPVPAPRPGSSKRRRRRRKRR